MGSWSLLGMVVVSLSVAGGAVEGVVVSPGAPESVSPPQAARMTTNGARRIVRRMGLAIKDTTSPGLHRFRLLAQAHDLCMVSPGQ